MSNAIQRQSDLIRKDKADWADLAKLADAEDVPGFYARYAQYLESRGIYSTGRVILHRMALLAAQK